MTQRIAALVLAAGASSRFGSPKALARLHGRPVLEHVLDAVRDAGISRIVVVLGHAADEIEDGIDWLDETIVRNPDPRHLSSSLQVGMSAIEELEPPAEAVLVTLGDQPRTRSDVIRALAHAARATDCPVVVPRYRDGGGANPVLVRRPAFDLVDEASGDRGLGPVLADHPELVEEVAVEGANPDVDTPGDLALIAWADQVRANREQVDRVREVPDGPDFYAPVSSLFRSDPDRTGDAVLDALLDLAEPGDTWLDIGAGAGRFALPIARRVRSVVAIDPSAGMLAALREQLAEYGIGNVVTLEGRWPAAAGDEVMRALGSERSADVALMAHVGYDIEAIGPFLDAMESAVSRRCLAVLMERQPSSAADPFWPPVHDESRVPLPALHEFVDLLRARGRVPEVRTTEREPRWFETRDELMRFVRRQLWIADGGEKERRFLAVFDELVEHGRDGWAVRDRPPADIGIVSWAPRGG